MAKLYFVILAVTLQMVSASPRQFPGFTYLGSAPKSDDPSTMASYYLSANGETWQSAFTTCGLIGGQLVSPINPIQDNTLRTFMIESQGGAVIWTGARKTGNVWKWEPKNIDVIWSNWHSPTCPTNTGCASAYTSGTKWAWCSENCANSRYYVCEFN